MILKMKKGSNKISKPLDVAKIFRDILMAEDEIDRDKEHFWIAGLSTANRIVYIELVTLGLLDRALVAPRETFRLAIMKGVSKIVAVHNHPSGNTQPSNEDRATMKSLANAGKILEIKLMDFIIIASNSKECWSASDSGHINF